MWTKLCIGEQTKWIQTVIFRFHTDVWRVTFIQLSVFSLTFHKLLLVIFHCVWLRNLCPVLHCLIREQIKDKIYLIARKSCTFCNPSSKRGCLFLFAWGAICAARSYDMCLIYFFLPAPCLALLLFFPPSWLPSQENPISFMNKDM